MSFAGYRITACAATPSQAALVLSVPKRNPADETQETLRTTMFPSTHVKASTRGLLLAWPSVAEGVLGKPTLPYL